MAVEFRYNDMKNLFMFRSFLIFKKKCNVVRIEKIHMGSEISMTLFETKKKPSYLFLY